MRLYHLDVSEPEICGNGIQCVARFESDLYVPSRILNRYTVDTLASPMMF